MPLCSDLCTQERLFPAVWVRASLFSLVDSSAFVSILYVLLCFRHPLSPYRLVLFERGFFFSNSLLVLLVLLPLFLCYCSFDFLLVSLHQRVSIQAFPRLVLLLSLFFFSFVFLFFPLHPPLFFFAWFLLSLLSSLLVWPFFFVCVPTFPCFLCYCWGFLLFSFFRKLFLVFFTLVLNTLFLV